MNEMFILSYKALAAANMKLGNYELALRKQYELAEDRNGYSEAFGIFVIFGYKTIYYLCFGLLLA